MKRIFFIGSLAIAVVFAVANLSIAKQDIRMSLFLENAIALSTENNSDNQTCYTQVDSQDKTGVFVRKCAQGTDSSTRKPCNNDLIETNSGYYYDPQSCFTENTTP
jgi:hypothetical protein